MRHHSPSLPSLLRVCGLLVCLALLTCGASAASTDVHVVKLAADGKTVLAERTVDYRWLEANLPVKGDGSTHYYHQGPTFDDADLWDPTESKNVQDKDMGAVKGTALRDLCGLVGGMQSGDSLVVRASDGFSKRFSYGSVYSPSARQGQMVLTWYKAGEGYVPGYSTGMRVVFFADTSTNPWGLHVFGNADMKAAMPSGEWHYFNGVYPTTTGLSVQSVSELRILSTQAATTAATTKPATTATAAKTTATTRATTSPGATGVTATPTTSPASTVTATTTVPAGEDGPAAVTPTGAAPTTGSTPTAATTATSNLTVNGTGTVVPSPTDSAAPAATGYGSTGDSSIVTGLDYVTDLEDVGTATPTPTVTATAAESPAAPNTTPPVVATAPSRPPTPSPTPSSTIAPKDTDSSRSLSFTFSFEIRESGNGPTVDAPRDASAAVVSPASPLGALWAFVKAVARLIDPFLT